MNLYLFTIETISILCVPGPTNTLLAISGAACGLRKSFRLLLAEAAAYSISTSLLVAVVMPMLNDNAFVNQSLRLACSFIIWYQAGRLWKFIPSDEDRNRASPVTATQLFVTTLGNPKNVIFALITFAHSGLKPTQLWLWVACFMPLCSCIGFAWISIGASMGRSRILAAAPITINRLGACVLLIFGAMISVTFVKNIPLTIK